MSIPAADAVYLSLLAVVMVIGNVGNTLVIGAVLCDKHLRSKEGNMFILNLAIADLCVTGLKMSYFLVIYVYRLYNGCFLICFLYPRVVDIS